MNLQSVGYRPVVTVKQRPTLCRSRQSLSRASAWLAPGIMAGCLEDLAMTSWTPEQKPHVGLTIVLLPMCTTLQEHHTLHGRAQYSANNGNNDTRPGREDSQAQSGSTLQGHYHVRLLQCIASHDLLVCVTPFLQ
jgi:hypothetical protein